MANAARARRRVRQHNSIYCSSQLTVINEPFRVVLFVVRCLYIITCNTIHFTRRRCVRNSNKLEMERHWGMGMEARARTHKMMLHFECSTYLCQPIDHAMPLDLLPGPAVPASTDANDRPARPNALLVDHFDGGSVRDIGPCWPRPLLSRIAVLNLQREKERKREMLVMNVFLYSSQPTGPNN